MGKIISKVRRRAGYVAVELMALEKARFPVLNVAPDELDARVARCRELYEKAKSHSETLLNQEQSG